MHLAVIKMIFYIDARLHANYDCCHLYLSLILFLSLDDLVDFCEFDKLFH